MPFMVEDKDIVLISTAVCLSTFGILMRYSISQNKQDFKKPHRRHEARARKIVEEEKMELHHRIKMFTQH